MTVYALGEIFEIARGGSPRPIDQFITDEADGINWVLIGDANEGSKYIEKTKKKIKPSGISRSRTVKPGDFLLTNSMSFGRPYIMRTSGCIHDGWLSLSRKMKNIDPSYFYYLLGSPVMYSEFTRLAAGATVKNLNIDLVSGVRVPVPPLDEQRRIAAILDQAGALRRERREALGKVSRLPSALFEEMFPTDGDFPRVKLSTLCQKITDGTHQAPKWSDDGIPFIFVSNVRNGRISLDTGKRVSPETYRELTRVTPIERGDVLYTAVGSYGNAAVIDTNEEFVFQRHIAHIKPDHARLNSRFLAVMLEAPIVRRQADRAANGLAQKTVTLADLKGFEVICPPKKMQDEFERRVREVDRQQLRQSGQLDGMEALFAAIQDRAFQGELSSAERRYIRKDAAA